MLLNSISDIILLLLMNYLITYWSKQLIFQMCYHDDNKIHVNWQSLVQIACIVFLLKNISYISLRQWKNFPYSTSLIAYVTVFYHNVSVFVIIHSQYMPKYYFYMFTASLLYYQYLSSYPMANATLTNIVYLCFALY